MKTPNLITVPKDSPTRKQRLESLKQSFGIETHFSKAFEIDDNPWIAGHLPTARRMGYGVTDKSDLFDCVAKIGRLMEDNGSLVEGRTEREAIHLLCKNLGLPFTL